MNPVRAVICLVAALALACGTTTRDDCDERAHYRQVLQVAEHGAAVFDIATLRTLFPNASCDSESVTSAIDHSDAAGCTCCLTVDLMQHPNCRFSVRTIYLTLNASSREEAGALARELVEGWQPEGSTDDEQTLPTATATETNVRHVFRDLKEIHEVRVDTTPVASRWRVQLTFDHYSATR